LGVNSAINSNGSHVEVEKNKKNNKQAGKRLEMGSKIALMQESVTLEVCEVVMRVVC
jgi:hypothetical protein